METWGTPCDGLSDDPIVIEGRADAMMGLVLSAVNFCLATEWELFLLIERLVDKVSRKCCFEKEEQRVLESSLYLYTAT